EPLHVEPAPRAGPPPPPRGGGEDRARGPRPSPDRGALRARPSAIARRRPGSRARSRRRPHREGRHPRGRSALLRGLGGARGPRAFARLYADGPSAILVGWGMQRRVNGAAIVRAVDALAAVSGNMGRKGGGSLFYRRRRKAFDLGFIQGAPVAPRSICEPLMG